MRSSITLTPGDLSSMEPLGASGMISKISTNTYGTVAYKHWRTPLNKKEHEIEILAQLKMSFHPNILSFFAFVDLDFDQDKTIGYVMEFMEGGSLADVILPKPGADQIPYREEHYLSWAQQACSALAFCHQHNFLHRDVKPGNLLLSADRTRLKVGDFGIAKKSNESIGVETVRYMAPELFNPSENESSAYTEKCDVFSMGITMWEMITRQVPYSSACRTVVQLKNSIKNGLRPFMSAEELASYKERTGKTAPTLEYNSINNDLRDIITRCWRADYEKRPTMEELRDYLNELVDAKAENNIKLKRGNEHMLRLPVSRSDLDIDFWGDNTPNTKAPAPTMTEMNSPALAPEPMEHESVSLSSHTSNMAIDTLTARPEPYDQTNLTGNWDIEKLNVISQDSSGSLYKANSKRLGVVAFMRWDGNVNMGQHRNELLAVCKIPCHPNLCRFFGRVELNSKTIGYAMEYMDGGSLDTLIQNPEVIYELKDCLKWAKQACLGLSYLHRHGFVHRDVKPSNMLLTNNMNILKVSGFHSTRHIDRRMTGCVGTIAYMAPELCSTTDESVEYDGRCDVYSMTISLWEMLARSYPFDNMRNNILKITEMVVNQHQRPSLEKINCETMPEMVQVLTRGWEACPAERSTMDEMLDQLESISHKLKVDIGNLSTPQIISAH